MLNLAFKNRYQELGEGFYDQSNPAPVSKPSLIKFNEQLAAELGIEVQDEQSIVDLFSGNTIHNSSSPLAMAYAGHQFGHFNPHLGDGRAIYLGELEHIDGRARDVQLKGSGRTRYSRNGDGRSALGPVMREYLVSEAMHKLKMPTTRALAAVLTGEHVIREQVKPGAVMTRVASSFIRVGSFQYFAMNEDLESIRKLADYVIERNYPELAEAENPYLALFEAAVMRQASLIAKWMQIGFIHGVMNTDNMSVAGETIDYGPCAFMGFFDHNQVYSSIDHQGRYSYSNQPNIGLWNLSRFAETLLPFFVQDTDKAVEIAQDVLEQKYVKHYSDEWLAGFRAKCGLTKIDSASDEDDKALIDSLLDTMAKNQADYTLTFYYLSQLDKDPNDNDQSLRGLFSRPKAIDVWLEKWRERLSLESNTNEQRQTSMQSVNPVYIPRNHQIEATIRAAEDNEDFGPFHALYDVLQKPYEYQQGKENYMLPPEPNEIVHQTFCGT